MQVYLAMDPWDFRILAQSTPIDRDLDLPRGAQGEGWPTRHLTVHHETWASLLSGALSAAEQDEIHIQWWNDAREPGAPLWPDLPKG